MLAFATVLCLTDRPSTIDLSALVQVDYESARLPVRHLLHVGKEIWAAFARNVIVRLNTQTTHPLVPPCVLFYYLFV